MSRGGVSVPWDLCPVGSVQGLSVWGFLSRRVSICQSLSLVSMSRGGDLCPGWGLCPGRSVHGVSGDFCPGGTLLGSCPGGLYLRESQYRGLCPGGLCLGVYVQGRGSLCRGSMPRGGSHYPWGVCLVVSVQEGLYQGVPVQGVSI